jgi:uncharacterized protein YndB with AHSA1/START domain
MPTTSAASSQQGPRGPQGSQSPHGPFGPVDIALQADIRAPVEVVWDLLVDWEHMGRWMLEASGFQVTTQHHEGVGVEVEAKIRIGGITTTDTVRVTRWEPPHVLAADHLGWVKGDALMQCIPTEQGTRLEWVERLVPPLGPLGGIGIRLFKPLMVRTFVRDLSVLMRLAETRAGTRTTRPAPGERGSGDRGSGEAPDGRENTGSTRDPGGPGTNQPLDGADVADSASDPSRPRPPAAARAQPPREASSLFARWFWLVYLPLALLTGVILLTVAGLMPAGLRTPLLTLTGAWSALALVILVERRRRHVAVRPPRRIVLGIGAVVLTGVAGALLTWIGIGKVSSSEGLAMLLVGCFFILMAVFAPMFKLVDSALRLVVRLVTRRSRSGDPRPARASSSAGPSPAAAPSPTPAEGVSAASSQP